MISEKELRQMYCDDEMSKREIAEVIGANSPSDISYLMKKYKIKPRTISEAQLIKSVKPSKAELEEMYFINGMTTTEIADKISVSYSSIYLWMQEYGIKFRPRSAYSPCLKISKEELVEMYHNKRMSSFEIADEIGVNDSTILRWMHEYCIEVRTISETRLDKYFGENNPNWRGGPGKYCYKFNNKFKESVRVRDDYTCQLCGSKQNGRKLSIHHIHYDAENCWPDVVALCHSCHSRVNGNRDYWENYFENHLIERGLYCWSISQET